MPTKLEPDVPEQMRYSPDEDLGPRRVKVAKGTQINIEGTLYQEGETFDVPEANLRDARGWVDAGIAEEVGQSAPKTTAKKSTAPKRTTTKAKAKR